MNDPAYIGSDRNTQAAIERAHRIGTYDKDDRTPQYDGPERAHPSVLLASQNVLWTRTRRVESSHTKLWDKTANVESQQVRLDREMQANQAKVKRDMEKIAKRANLNLRNGLLVALAGGVVARAPEIVLWALRIFR